KLRPRKVLGYERQERVREFGLLFGGVPMGRDKVGCDEGRRGQGARERCGKHGDFLLDWWRKGSGRFGDRIGVGVRGRRRERRVDRGKLAELVVELALKRERDAEARSERRRPCLPLRDHASLLGKVRFEASERVLEPGDEPERGQVEI